MAVVGLAVVDLDFFAGMDGAAFPSDSVFLFLPAVAEDVAVVVVLVDVLLFDFPSSAFASLSFFDHCFFISASNLAIWSGTARVPLFSASSNRVFATAFVFEGLSP